MGADAHSTNPGRSAGPSTAFLCRRRAGHSVISGTATTVRPDGQARRLSARPPIRQETRHPADGAAVTWHASFRLRAGEAARVDVEGIDIVLVRDGKITRDEVFFDRAALAPLLAGQTV